MNSPVASNDRETTRKRKRMITVTKMNQNDLAGNKTRWRTESEQRIYSSKLIEALRHVRRSSNSSAAAEKPRGRDVREAAYRVLAVSAKGRTRWSRAILRTSMLRLRLKKVKKQKLTGTISYRPAGESATKSVPAVQRRLRILGRLVPGCRKLPASNLLEETKDYIAALEMQVRAMSAIAEILVGESANGVGLASNRLGSSLTVSSS